MNLFEFTTTWIYHFYCVLYWFCSGINFDLCWTVKFEKYLNYFHDVQISMRVHSDFQVFVGSGYGTLHLSGFVRACDLNSNSEIPIYVWARSNLTYKVIRCQFLSVNYLIVLLVRRSFTHPWRVFVMCIVKRNAPTLTNLIFVTHMIVKHCSVLTHIQITHTSMSWIQKKIGFMTPEWLFYVIPIRCGPFIMIIDTKNSIEEKIVEKLRFFHFLFCFVLFSSK